MTVPIVIYMTWTFTRVLAVGATVVLHMMEPLYDCNHNVYTDNVLSISLAKKLKDNGTVMIGTASTNRHGWPKEMKGIKNWINRLYGDKADARQ